MSEVLALGTGNILIISSSLNEESISRKLANYVYQKMKAKSDITTFCDLRAYPLPLCNGKEQNAYSDPNVKTLHDMIHGADSIVLATPVYNFNTSAALKNLIELTGTPYKDILDGKSWNNKLVGFLLGQGTIVSYMSSLPLMNSLMLDFGCIIYPKFVHALQGDFAGDVPNTKVTDRLENFVEKFWNLHKKLSIPIDYSRLT